MLLKENLSNIQFGELKLECSVKLFLRMVEDVSSFSLSYPSSVLLVELVFFCPLLCLFETAPLGDNHNTIVPLTHTNAPQ